MFRILKLLVRLVCKALFFVKVIGLENLPKEGAVIVAANHTSFWDAPVLVTALPRYTRVMAKKELFDHKLLKPILKLGGAFPVNRGTNDIGAIKTALQTLKNGDVFTIFPTGTRIPAGEASEAKSGVALIAHRSGAPVIPVFIENGYHLFRQVKIHFGKPIMVQTENGKKPSSEELKAFADTIMEKIDSLGA